MHFITLAPRTLSAPVTKSALIAQWRSQDTNLLELYDQLGAKWSQIAQVLTGRTDSACRRRSQPARPGHEGKDVFLYFGGLGA